MVVSRKNIILVIISFLDFITDSIVHVVCFNMDVILPMITSDVKNLF
jgi:hypothetical protein